MDARSMLLACFLEILATAHLLDCIERSLVYLICLSNQYFFHAPFVEWNLL